MTDSKLIELLRKLEPRQLTRLGDFLQSPYFNKNRDCVLFFEYLQKYAPAFSHKNLSKEMLLRQAFTEKPLDEKSLAHLSSRLLALAEKFLAAEAFFAGEWEQQICLLQQYQVLDLPKFYKTIQADVEKLLEEFPFRNAGYYRKQSLAKRIFYEHGDLNQRTFNERLQTAADSLDAHFAVEKMRYACEMLNLEAMLNVRYNIPHLDEVLGWSAEPVFRALPAVQVYGSLLRMLRQPDEPGIFEAAKTQLVQWEHCFDPQERKQLYLLLLNYCTRRINRLNDERFLHEYLEINKLLLEKGLIFEDGSLPPSHYSNIVAVGLKTGQTDWTGQFILDYRGKLPETHAEHTYRYNLARYHYHLREYDQAQRALLQVDISDVLRNIAVRSLLIKIYCETEQTELLLSYLEATRIYLHRNQLLDMQVKRQMQKFVEFTTKLAKTRPGDREKFQALLEVLPPAKELMHRDWLAGQLEEKSGRR